MHLDSSRRLVLLFFVLAPAVPSVLGHLVLPHRLGDRDLALPVLSIAGFTAFVVGLVIVAASSMVGAEISVWTMSSAPRIEGLTALGLLWTGLLFATTSWSLIGINILISIGRRFGHGLHLHGMPVLVWTLKLAALQLVAASIIVGVGLLRFAFGYDDGLSYFGPGSDIWSRLTAFLTLTALTPIVGAMTEAVADLARRTGRRTPVEQMSIVGVATVSVVGAAIVLIGGRGSEMSPVVSAALHLAAIVPCAMVAFHWLAMLYGGAVSRSAASGWLIVFFATAGFVAVLQQVLANPELGRQLRGTAFAVVRDEALVWGAVVGCLMTCLHQWWPRVCGARPGQAAAWTSMLLYAIGFLAALTPLLANGGGAQMYVFSDPRAGEVIASLGRSMILIALVIGVGNLMTAKRRGDASRATS